MRRRGLLTSTGRLIRPRSLSRSMMSCHPTFFITRHLKNAESHKIAQLVGHKNVATTLKHNRYAIDHDKVREILDGGIRINYLFYHQKKGGVLRNVPAVKLGVLVVFY